MLALDGTQIIVTSITGAVSVAVIVVPLLFNERKARRAELERLRQQQVETQESNTRDHGYVVDELSKVRYRLVDVETGLHNNHVMHRETQDEIRVIKLDVRDVKDDVREIKGAVKVQGVRIEGLEQHNDEQDVLMDELHPGLHQPTTTPQGE